VPDKQHSAPGGQFIDSGWSGLCRIGGVAAFLLAVYSLATMVQLVIVGGPPATATEAFSLLQSNRILGLLRLDLPTILAMPLYYLVFLGLFAALRRADCAYAAFSTALAFVGVTLFLAAPAALSMISLSEKHAAAKTEAARVQLEAAGEAILATDIWHGTSAFMGGILLQSGAVLISVIMLRSDVFSKTVACVGILTYGLDLAHIVLSVFLPAVGVVLMAVAGPLYLIWFPLLGRRLLQLGRAGHLGRPHSGIHGRRCRPPEPPTGPAHARMFRFRSLSVPGETQRAGIAAWLCPSACPGCTAKAGWRHAKLALESAVERGF